MMLLSQVAQVPQGELVQLVYKVVMVEQEQLVCRDNQEEMAPQAPQDSWDLEGFLEAVVQVWQPQSTNL